MLNAEKMTSNLALRERCSGINEIIVKSKIGKLRYFEQRKEMVRWLGILK